LLEHVRITDTFGVNDTLSVTPTLVAEANKFFELLSAIVGSNFLKVPCQY
jgi:hypothetical protein